jgi:type II secretory pathway pseudopilin PulG
MTLIEVMVSIALATIIILGALMVRYYAVRQAVRADAYETAGRIGQLFLEGWRSTELQYYEPYDRLAGQLPITVAGAGYDVTDAVDFLYTSPLGSSHYDIFTDNIHYNATLGYMNAITTAGAERPQVIHVTVAFRNDYQAGDVSTGAIYLRLTTNK